MFHRDYLDLRGQEPRVLCLATQHSQQLDLGLLGSGAVEGWATVQPVAESKRAHHGGRKAGER